MLNDGGGLAPGGFGTERWVVRAGDRRGSQRGGPNAWKQATGAAGLPCAQEVEVNGRRSGLPIGCRNRGRKGISCAGFAPC